MLDSSALIYSDEPATGKIWAILVTDLRCRPIVVNSVPLAIQAIETSSPDLIVIDVTFRGTSASQICSALREHATGPILVLTPINNETHTLEAYGAGADECIVKPISPALFAVKAGAWLRRARIPRTGSLERLVVGNLALEAARRELVTGGGRKIRLSHHEFRALYLLLSHPNQPFSNEQIIEQVWGFNGEGGTNLLKSLVYRLRKKLQLDPTGEHDILSVPGGYSFRL